MELLQVAKLVKCGRCGRGQGEDYGHFVLIRNRGFKVRVYGPGLVVIDCKVCGETNTVNVGSRDNANGIMFR